MKRDGCLASLEISEAWKAIEDEQIVKWCFRCKRFRVRECPITFDRLSILRKDMFQKMKEEGRFRNGRRSRS